MQFSATVFAIKDCQQVSDGYFLCVVGGHWFFSSEIENVNDIKFYALIKAPLESLSICLLTM